MKNENQINIVEASLWDFLVSIQDAVKQGYVLSDKNEHFPQGFVSLYTATLVKPVECQHDWCFNSESSDGLEAEFQCSKCGEISITKKEPVAASATNEVQVTTPVKELTIADIVTNELIKTTAKKPKVK